MEKITVFCLIAAMALLGWAGYGRWQAQAEEAYGEDAGNQYVALTFDDGPNPEYTPVLLDGLKERGVKASFFLLGKYVEENQELVRRMVEEGHLVGNHSFNHVILSKVPVEEAVAEIEKTNDAIKEVTGESPRYIRPPYGEWNDQLDERIDMEKVLWNVDPLDWKVLDREKVAGHIMTYVRNGSIILLHDSYPSTVEAAFEVIDTLKDQGYTFVTVDELLVD